MSEEQEVIDLLQSFIDDINALMDMIGDKPRLFGIQKEKANRALKVLKEKFASEVHRVSTRRGKQTLSKFERNYYAPAVQEAKCDLRIRVGSVPGSAWRSALYEARLDLSHVLDQLKKKK